MVALVSGVGAAVFAYCPAYFGTARSNPRTAATLVAFSGAMLGLVLADDLLALYLFWELTSVTSYLLIGYDDTDADVPPGRPAGAADHRHGRAGDAGRLRPARRGRRDVLDLGDPGRPAAGRRR